MSEVDNTTEELLDSEETQNEEDNLDYQDEETEDAPKKKNSSNFKKLNKALKWAMATIKELESKIEEKSDEPKIDTTELRLFLVETPEAKEYKEGILEALNEFPNITLEKAFAYAKANAPKSQDKEDFSLKTKTSSTKKDIMDLTEEEALEKLDNKDYLKYMRWKGKFKF